MDWKSVVYSQKCLLIAGRFLHFKSIWRMPKEKIPSARKRLGLGADHPERWFGNRVQIVREIFAGYPYYVLTPKDGVRDVCVFYSHGGGYVFDISFFHWEFLTDLCARSHCRMIVPIYPLAPEFSKSILFPWLCSLYEKVSHEFLGKKMILMGDSAGGGLSLALALRLLALKKNAFDDLILISPWLDVTMNSSEMWAVDRVDPMLDLKGLLHCGMYYLGDDTDDIVSSPLNGDFYGIAHAAVFTGTRDCLNPMANTFRAKCVEQEVGVSWYEYRDSLHVFPIFRTCDGLHAREELLMLLE